jgi:tetratricopeptide (TPR) repeat protein
LLGRVHECRGDLDAALTAFLRGQQPDLFGAKLGYDGGDLYLGAARVLRKLGRWDEAQLALAKAAYIWRALPENNSSRNALAAENAFAALERGDALGAREYAERAFRPLPARPEYDALREELGVLQARLVIAGVPTS